MKKALRKIIVLIFFILFFILAPLLTAYSLGYRYDFKTGNIQKNGAFYIKSYPRGAEIFINNEKERRKTPTQLIDILPGTYTVEVTKNNYVSWIKKLEVSSGETTFAEDIVLFLKDRQKNSLSVGSEKILLNKNADKYVLLDENNKLIITDVEQGRSFDIDTLDKKYELLDWSSDNQQLLIKIDNKYFAFDVDKKILEAIPIVGIQKMLWENNSQTLIYLKDNRLYRHYHRPASSSTGPADELLDIKNYINDFAIKNNWLIIQYTFDKNNFVEQLDKNNLTSKQVINNVNLGSLEVLLAEDDYLIFTIGAKLYIKNILRELITIPITTAKLHDERLLITNGHEIILFNYQEEWQELIDRSSNIVADVFWHPNGSYFVSEINDSTTLTELDGRDKRNNIELVNNPRKKNYVFDKKGEKLFIISPEENYYLSIQ